MSDRLLQKVPYAVCMFAAAIILLMLAGRALPSKHPRFVSTHPASTMPPLMGFSADSVFNTGDAKALDAFPGIGKVLSQRMIDTRNSLAGFRLPEDLMLVKGIGEKTLAGIMSALEEPLVQLTELTE